MEDEAQLGCQQSVWCLVRSRVLYFSELLRYLDRNVKQLGLTGRDFFRDYPVQFIQCE